MKKIISCLLVSLLFFNTNAFAKNINQLNKQKSQIKNKINSSKQELSETKEEKKSALKQIESLDTQLDNVVAQLEKLENELKITKDNLQKTQAELEQAEKTMEKQYESLKKRLRVMYEYGNETYLDLILEAKSFTNFFKRIEYINKITKHDQKVLKRYEEIKNEVAQKLEEVKIQKQNIEVLTKQSEMKKQELTKSLNYKQQMVEKLKNEEKYLEQQLKDLEKEDREITTLINQAKVKITGSSKNKIYAGSGGILAHPVPAYAGAPYNDVYISRINPITKKREFHTGLDLKAKYGTDIVAAESGTVIFSGRRGGYGNTVIIDHGKGMTTLYAHNSSLSVSKGQTVKRGQVIAKAGSTGYSTGVHAHFEVRINGKHTDPAPYLK